MARKLIVIGAGMASGRMLEHIFDAGGDFDVTLFNHVPEARLRIAPVSYVHLFHPRDIDGRDRFDEVARALV